MVQFSSPSLLSSPSPGMRRKKEKRKKKREERKKEEEEEEESVFVPSSHVRRTKSYSPFAVAHKTYTII